MKQLVFLTIAMFMYSTTFAQVVKKPVTTPKQETVVEQQQQLPEQQQQLQQLSEEKAAAANPETMAATEPQPSEEKAGFTELRLGLSSPGGDFADGKDKGYGAGLKFYSPLESVFSNFSLVYGAELYYHPLNSNGKKELDDLADEGESVTYPMYFNVPLTIGGNIAFPLNPGLSIYGEAMAGVNISYITPQKWELDSNNKYEITFEPAYGFCYGVEGGIVFNKKISIGVRYNNLGTLEYKYKSVLMEDGESTEESDLTTSKFDLKNTVLVLGIRF